MLKFQPIHSNNSIPSPISVFSEEGLFYSLVSCLPCQAIYQYSLYALLTDAPKSFDALSGLIRNEPRCDPRSGFINKNHNKLKLLHWTGGGFTMYYKRLEHGTFELPNYGRCDDGDADRWAVDQNIQQMKG